MAKKMQVKTDESATGAILVTGGSGFVGRQLVKSFSNDGKTAVSMYHHRLPEPMPNVYPVCSDLGSTELLGAPLRGIETVIYLAWEHSFVGSSEDIDIDPYFRNTSKNITVLRNLLRAMEHAGTKRIIFLSALGAKKNSDNPFLKEKYYAEFAILNSKIAEKVIIRSSIICGGGLSHDRFIKSVRNLMKWPWVYPVPLAKDYIAPVHIADITALLNRLVAVDLSDQSAILEITGEKEYQIDELFKIICDRFVKKAKLPLRGMMGNTLTHFFERNARDAADAPRIKDYLALHNRIDADTARGNPLMNEIPNPRHSFEDALSSYCD